MNEHMTIPKGLKWLAFTLTFCTTEDTIKVFHFVGVPCIVVVSSLKEYYGRGVMGPKLDHELQRSGDTIDHWVIMWGAEIKKTKWERWKSSGGVNDATSCSRNPTTPGDKCYSSMQHVYSHGSCSILFFCFLSSSEWFGVLILREDLTFGAPDIS